MAVPSFQHPFGELHATAGLLPAAAGDVVVVAGLVLPPTMGVGDKPEDEVEDAGEGLVPVVFAAPPNEPTIPDTIDIACTHLKQVKTTD